MVKELIARHLLVFVALFALTASAFAYFAGAAGKYKGSTTLEGLGDLALTAEIKGADDKLTGIIHSSQGDAEIIDGNVKDGKITLQIMVGDEAAAILGTIDDTGKITGTVAGDQINGTIELTPIKEDKPNE